MIYLVGKLSFLLLYFKGFNKRSILAILFRRFIIIDILFAQLPSSCELQINKHVIRIVIFIDFTSTNFNFQLLLAFFSLA